MSNMKNRFLMLALTLTVLAGASTGGLNVYAAQSTNQTATAVGTKGAEVEATLASNFTITIPKKVVMTTKTATYTVSVTGDFSSDEKITVVPEASFRMSDQAEVANKKPDVTATIAQDKTGWLFNETATKGNGTITANDLSAGNWAGTFNFTISKQTGI